MMTVTICALVVVVLIGVSPPARRFAKSIFAWGEAKADRAAENVANADPLGVYKTKIANAVENGKLANAVVEQAAKQLISLENQIASDLKEQTRLTNRIQAVVDKGDPNNTAAGYAADLGRVEESLVTNQEQRDLAQNQYDSNLKLVERYEREISLARKDADQLGLQLAQSEAEKNLYQMTASLKDTLSLGDLAQARQRIQDNINANKGSAKASRDLGKQDFSEEDDLELEREAAAAAILDRFKKKPDVSQ